jgi:hypothetical protein
MSWVTVINAVRTRFQTQVVANYAGAAPQVAGTDIAAGASGYTSTTTALNVFTDGPQVIVAGFTETNNNGLKRITTQAAALLAVSETLTVEAAGDAVTIKTALPVQYDNDAAFKAPDNRMWVRFSVLPAAEEWLEIGASRTVRSTMLAIAQIFSPIGTGDGTPRALADTIATAFRGVSASSIVYGLPYIGVDGMVNAWHQINVNIPFQTDTTGV